MWICSILKLRSPLRSNVEVRVEAEGERRGLAGRVRATGEGLSSLLPAVHRAPALGPAEIKAFQSLSKLSKLSNPPKNGKHENTPRFLEYPAECVRFFSICVDSLDFKIDFKIILRMINQSNNQYYQPELI